MSHEHDDPEQQRPGTVSRRAFLGMASSVGIGAATKRVRVTKNTAKPLTAVAGAGSPATTLAPGVVPTTVRASPSGIPSTPGILVMVTLYGGNDGLNMLIPLDAGPYLSGRGALAYPAAEALALGEGFGLHPNMGGLKTLWDARRLAVVRGVGYPSPSRSHWH